MVLAAAQPCALADAHFSCADPLVSPEARDQPKKNPNIIVVGSTRHSAVEPQCLSQQKAATSESEMCI